MDAPKFEPYIYVCVVCVQCKLYSRHRFNIFLIMGIQWLQFKLTLILVAYILNYIVINFIIVLYLPPPSLCVCVYVCVDCMIETTGVGIRTAIIICCRTMLLCNKHVKSYAFKKGRLKLDN